MPLRNSSLVIKTLLGGLEAANYMNLEIYLLIIQKLQSELRFEDANKMLTLFENLKSEVIKEDSVSLRWSNPLMVMVLSLDILKNLKQQFRSLSLRINEVTDNVRKSFVDIYENFDSPEKLEVLLR